jgi:hypothetical protein
MDPAAGSAGAEDRLALFFPPLLLFEGISLISFERQAQFEYFFSVERSFLLSATLVLEWVCQMICAI